MAEWNVNVNPNFRQAALGKEPTVIVTLAEKSKKELTNMILWGEGDSDEHYDSADVRSWRAMCPNDRPSDVLGHLDVKLQRLAVMLARHDGMELEHDYTLEIPHNYFEDAKTIMTHSAEVISRHIKREKAERAKKKAQDLQDQVELTKVTRKAELDVEEERPFIYLEGQMKNKREMLWSTFYNRAKSKKGIPTEAAFWKELIEDHPDFELHKGVIKWRS